MIKWLFNREFLKKMGALAIPIALQEVFTTLLQFIDTIMVSHIDTIAKTESGESIAIAAVSFAGNNFFLFILFMVGITSGLSIFSAQYWGDNDIVNVRKTLGLSLLGSIGAALLFSIPSFFFAESFIEFFSKDPEVIALGAKYLKILAISYVFTGVTFSLSSILKSVAEVKTPIIVSIGAVLLNTLLNYMLIFGELGAPELGVAGAAIGTTIAKIIEMFALIALVYYRKSPLASKNLSDYFIFPAGFVKKKIITTLPVIGNEMGWAMGIFAYNKVYATLGTDAAMSFSLAERVSFLFIVAFIGTSAATATLIGNTIGKGNLEEAQDNSKRIMFFAIGGATLFAIVSGLSAPLWTAYVFNIETEVMRETINALIVCTAILLPFKVINMHGVNGLMRSGGDTHFSMYVDIGTLWIIGVPIAIVSATVFHLPLHVVYLLIGIEELIKAVIVLNRIRSGKWINRVIEE